GGITPFEAERLGHWFEQGYVILENAVDRQLCDQLRSDLDAALREGDDRLLMHSPASPDYQPLRPGIETDRARIVDVYVYFDSARRALFSKPIVEFLRLVFDDAPLLFQS